MSFPSSDNGEDCIRHQQTVHNMQPFCYFSISYQSYHSMMLERSGDWRDLGHQLDGYLHQGNRCILADGPGSYKSI